MKPAIVVENLSKKFSRNIQDHRNYGLKDILNEALGRKHSTDLRPDEFWAVNDVSFTLYPGDALGLVGKNGAGKSTLLKLINGLIKQDSGKIIVDGKIQALINLGAGFDASLSGRENILNSLALNGLGSKDSASRLDAIVDFSELEDFIDSPIATYSSGMHARLGFSAAIHMDPTILLIDEILAVGDMAFQNKCFIKMHQLKKEGVTMILVSHTPASILQFCDCALWLHEGSKRDFGKATDVMHKYVEFMDQQEEGRREKLQDMSKEAQKAISEKSRPVNDMYGPVYDDMDRVQNLNVDFWVGNKTTTAIKVNEPVKIRYQFDLVERVTDLNISLVIYRKDGLHITTISTLNGDYLKYKHEGRVECEVDIPSFGINPGQYVLVMPIHEGKSYLYRNVMKEFTIINNKYFTWGLVNFDYTYHVKSK